LRIQTRDSQPIEDTAWPPQGPENLEKKHGRVYNDLLFTPCNKALPEIQVESAMKGKRSEPAVTLSLRKKIVFTFIFVSVALVFSEGVFRLTQKHRDYGLWKRQSLRYDYDPRFHWRIRPGNYIHKESGNIECINSIGLRCPEISIRKPPGSVRILALGGSSTYIVSPVTGESWTDILACNLTEKLGFPVEVINAGTPGYSAYQSAMRLKYELMDYDPDMVLVYHLANDMKLFWMDDPAEMISRWDRHGWANERASILNPNPLLDAACRYSQMVTHLRFKFIKRRMKKARVEEEGWSFHTLDKDITPQGLDFYKQNLLAMWDTLNARGIPLVIVKQGTLVDPGNTPKQREMIKYRYYGFTHEKMVEAYNLGWKINDLVCEQRDNAYCSDAAAEIPRTDEYFDDSVHLTDKGRELLAKILTRHLIEFFGDFGRFRENAPQKERPANN